MKDRYGFTYEQRKATQALQLSQWEKVLNPEVLESTKQIVDMIDRPASSPDEAHYVVMGTALSSLILDYPQHLVLVDKIMLGEINFIPQPVRA